MRNRFPQIATLLVLAIVMTMALPSSFAKYSKTETYTIELKKNMETPFSAITLYPSTDSSTATGAIELTQSGYYVIVAKGGDGGKGIIAYSSSTLKPDIAGGCGGLVAFKAYFSAGTKLYAYVGTAGGNSSNGTGGTAGSVLGVGKGGAGSNGADTLGGFASSFSSTAASAGGGAATSIFVNNANVSKNDYSKLLCVAGGGGGGGSWDYVYCYPKSYMGGLRTFPAGFGGDAGSSCLISSQLEYDSSLGTFYYGSKGTDGSQLPIGNSGLLNKNGDSQGNEKGTYLAYRESGYETFGKGGKKTSGGEGGVADKSWGDILPAYYGTAGLTFSDTTPGKGGDSNLYGGAGGGGYCGGGSGTGTSLDYGAGGGGGGSSFISNTTFGSSNTGVTILSASDISKYLNIALSTTKYTEKNISSMELNKWGTKWTVKYVATTTIINDNCYKLNGNVVSDGFVYIEHLDE